MWIIILLLQLLPFLILGVVAIALLVNLSMKKKTIGAFRIENGTLYTNEIIPKAIPINEIESIKINYYIRNGRKYLILFNLRNGHSAGLLITYNIEDELERLKKELKENGFER